MRIWLFAALAGLAGCTGTQPITFPGEPMLEYFPFDKNLDCRWEFQATNVEIPYALVAEIVDDQIDGDNRKYTVEYTKDCRQNDVECVEGEFVLSLVWTALGSDGVEIWRAETPAGATDFDPPLRMAEQYMKRGDVAETTTGGGDWTSTLTGFEDCPVRWNVDWTDCAHMVLESTGPGAGVAGEYWIINDFNIVAMDWGGPEGRWELSLHETLE